MSEVFDLEAVEDQMKLGGSDYDDAAYELILSCLREIRRLREENIDLDKTLDRMEVWASLLENDLRGAIGEKRFEFMMFHSGGRPKRRLQGGTDE